VDIGAVAEYLGHHDPGFTLRTYRRLMPGTPDRARRAMEEVFITKHPDLAGPDHELADLYEPPGGEDGAR
jgi:hypothetical protein